MKAVYIYYAALLILAAACPVSCRTLHQDQGSTAPWPPEWDVPIKLMSRGDLLERGGAMRALGVKKLANITKRASVAVSVQALANTLDTDDDLRVDIAGDWLLYECASIIDKEAGINTTGVSAAVELTITAAQVFGLSSRPSAKNKILLDFDGHTVTGTRWNTATKLVTIIANPYDTDGNPGSFSPAELSDIKAIWSVVAEDFAPFDVDVTTIDPGDAELNGTRVIIGGSSTDWYGYAGGAAWVGTFGTQHPCFVWPAELGPYNIKYVSASASHEAGHTLGLLHDGNATATYYEGNDVWAPIMGSSVRAFLQQWDKGEYPGSNNNQDDIAVMSSFIDLLPQQYGRSTGTASPLPPDGNVTGIIIRAGQTDFFKISARAGPITVEGSNAGILTYKQSLKSSIANLDIRLVLHRPDGTILQESDPVGASAKGMSASISTNLPADDTYYISITGVGAGDPQNFGYSNYGSLGQYLIRADYQRGTPITTVDPIDCVGDWTPWAACNQLCGGGTQTSTYRISRPARNAGRPCEADDGQSITRSCNTQPCQQSPPSPSPTFPGGTRVDCLGAWGPWNECTQPCGGGSQVATFSITVPASNGGSPCEAPNGARMGRLCNSQDCQQGNPSPSPFPSPSPPIPVSSPKPGSGSVTVMEVADVDLRRVAVVLRSGRIQYKCRAVVTIKTVASAQVAKARVLGQWSAYINNNLFNQILTRTSNATGAATFTSKLATGRFCSFEVKRVSLAGYSWRSAGVGTKSLTWW